MTKKIHALFYIMALTSTAAYAEVTENKLAQFLTEKMKGSEECLKTAEKCTADQNTKKTCLTQVHSRLGDMMAGTYVPADKAEFNAVNDILKTDSTNWSPEVDKERNPLFLAPKTPTAYILEAILDQTFSGSSALVPELVEDGNTLKITHDTKAGSLYLQKSDLQKPLATFLVPAIKSYLLGNYKTELSPEAEATINKLLPLLEKRRAAVQSAVNGMVAECS